MPAIARIARIARSYRGNTCAGRFASKLAPTKSAACRASIRVCRMPRSAGGCTVDRGHGPLLQGTCGDVGADSVRDGVRREADLPRTQSAPARQRSTHAALMARSGGDTWRM